MASMLTAMGGVIMSRVETGEDFVEVRYDKGLVLRISVAEPYIGAKISIRHGLVGASITLTSDDWMDVLSWLAGEAIKNCIV